MKRLILLALLTLPLSTPQASEHAPSAEGPSFEAILKELQEGNQRFISGTLKIEKRDAARRHELAGGQKPSAIILSCSDSRVPPELVFDKGLGELFTVRVAGNVLGAATVASIEYAVEHLGSKLIVVMGHESCGAVKAALSTPPNKSAGSPDLDALVSSIQIDRMERGSAAAPAGSPAGSNDDPTLRRPVMENVDGVANGLLTRSRIIRRHFEEGKISIVRAIYGLETGKVDFWTAEKPRAKSGHQRPTSGAPCLPGPRSGIA